MKIAKIEVETCATCPFLVSLFSNWKKQGQFCGKNAERQELEDYPNIPWWCPLEDTK